MKIKAEFYVRKGDHADMRKRAEEKIAAENIGKKIIGRFQKRTGSDEHYDRYTTDIVVLSRTEMEKKLGIAHTRTIMAALKK